MSQTLILGVGNTLLSDEGAGVHALHYLEEHGDIAGDVEFLDAGTLSFTLADAIASARNLIILDAAELSESPGKVRVFEGDELDDFLLSGNEVSTKSASRTLWILPASRSVCRSIGH